MSYTRAMPNIKPYPHQDHYDMSYHRQQLPQQQHHSVYRPAYHRIPSTPAVTPRVSNWVSSMTPEVSPIVVPSMSPAPLEFYSNYYYQQQYYRQPVVPSTNYHQQSSPLPIHHTLENSIITYDTTVEKDLQKELVKDVFFSPAMDREMSPYDSASSSASSTCAQSDDESDFGGSTEENDLLLLDAAHLFDFGLDLATTTSNNQTTTSSYEEVMMMAKKPNFTLSLKKFDLTQQYNLLPTPPAIEYTHFQEQQQNKRRCSDSVLQDRLRKKQRQHLRAFSHTTPPTSPRMLSTLKNETVFDGYDYFEEANESDDECVRPLDASDAQLDEEDAFSTTSWEEEDIVSENEESASEDDEEFKAPVKYTPKKQKKSIHPLCEKEELVQESVHDNDSSLLPQAPPRPTANPTIYQKLTKANVDWCRYCGTTEGVNWRPGPWGKRTLCNKHGCDYKGYGFACKLPRLDLTGFTKETIDQRERPVLQLYCSGCQSKESWEENVLVRCEGCPKAFHQKCCPTELSNEFVQSNESWFCDENCCENTRRKRIIVELPRKRLPLMCAPKSSSSSASSVTSETTSRPRRESSISSTR